MEKAKSMRAAITEDFEKVQNFDQWSNICAKWMKVKPELEINQWFLDISNQYKPAVPEKKSLNMKGEK